MTTTRDEKKVQLHHHFILHWFRLGDLRLHDNAALVHSCQTLTRCAKAAMTTTTTGRPTTTSTTTKTRYHILPLFCFDDRIFGLQAPKTKFGSLKCGPRRAEFILESVQDLQQQLQRHGSDLIVSYHKNQQPQHQERDGGGKPHTFVSHLIQKLSKAVLGIGGDSKTTTTKTTAVPTIQFTILCQDEVLKEERDAVRDMQSSLSTQQIASIQTHWGSTLYNLDDLPFQTTKNEMTLGDMPDTFTPFRNKVEKACQISPPLPIPAKELRTFFPSSKDPTGAAILQVLEPYLASSLSAPPTARPSMPSLHDLGYSDECIQQEVNDAIDSRGVSMEFVGGEMAAKARVQDYIWTQDLLRIYFDTRNGMLGANYSTKLSPWLAHGCISPRYIAQECRRYEQERGIQNKSTYWVVFELLWRDYCKFFCLKHGNRIFHSHGIVTSSSSSSSSLHKWNMSDDIVKKWRDGRTGYPLVDANMRELKATGFMSNRGRQNVCSFLALDLQQDWRVGADYFETTLLDYDVYSNWYNWCAVRMCEYIYA